MIKASATDVRAYFFPAWEATNLATAMICAVVRTFWKGGMIAPPWITCFCIRANGGFSRSRFGPTVPVAPAAASV